VALYYNVRVHPVTAAVLHFTPKIKNCKKFNDIISAAGRCTARRPFKNGRDVGSGPLVSSNAAATNYVHAVQTPARRSAAVYFWVNFFISVHSFLYFYTHTMNRPSVYNFILYYNIVLLHQTTYTYPYIILY